MARRSTTRNYWRESDPDFNPQFRRRWFEPVETTKPVTIRKPKEAQLPRKGPRSEAR
ncbi:hypothetical protein JL101_004695 [Skermanella rosea]|uniref:hypothetical protein n=1 Tax=Skermanella rosea TaxID=1817965 RepID=UPI001931BB77|nr:hypothetical protein [Skermanella rosea]UEM04744.1 hypothetical protein JL101_004695 [Skermanella rosea]